MTNYHDTAAQAADFAADQMAQRVVWSRLDFVQTPLRTVLAAMTLDERGTCTAIQNVGELWCERRQS